MVVGNHILRFSATENATHPFLSNSSKWQHSNEFRGLRTVGILFCAIGCCSLVFIGLFETFSPRLYSYYQDTLTTLAQWSSKPLERLYPGTAFAAASINFGPQTISYPHRDFANLSWGWCAITALGSYDPDQGGHLVLWDLKYVIRFPPGATILIPSAMIKHSNTSIKMGETRYSFAQYSSGGLFRWVDNGFMKDDDWHAKATAQQLQEREEARKLRWSKGLDMLSLWDEFSS